MQLYNLVSHVGIALLALAPSAIASALPAKAAAVGKKSNHFHMSFDGFDMKLRKRATAFLNDQGFVTFNRGEATVFFIVNGTLKSNGKLVTANEGDANIPFTSVSEKGSIKTTWSFNRGLSWANPAFLNGLATFCQGSNGRVYIVLFAQPDACAPVSAKPLPTNSAAPSLATVSASSFAMVTSASSSAISLTEAPIATSVDSSSTASVFTSTSSASIVPSISIATISGFPTVSPSVSGAPFSANISLPSLLPTAVSQPSISLSIPPVSIAPISIAPISATSAVSAPASITPPASVSGLPFPSLNMTFPIINATAPALNTSLPTAPVFNATVAPITISPVTPTIILPVLPTVSDTNSVAIPSVTGAPTVTDAPISVLPSVSIPVSVLPSSASGPAPLATAPVEIYDAPTCYSNGSFTDMQTIIGANMTLDSCQAICDGANYFADSENTCVCGTAFNATNAPVALPESSCDTTCPGNSSQICGGLNAFSTFNRTNNYTYADGGCYTTGNLNNFVTTTSLNNSVEFCSNFCTTNILSLDGNTCSCGTSFDTTNPPTKQDDILCNTPCPGNANETCGGTLGDTLYFRIDQASS